MARDLEARLLAVLAVAVLGFGCAESPAKPSPPAALTVTGIVPNTGPTGSAVVVTISGTGFGSGVTVTLDGVPMMVTTANTSRITATAPPHPTGAVELVVTNPGGGSARLPGAYTYVPVAIANISPAAASPGSPVTITGTGFLTISVVTFDGIRAEVTHVTTTSITARAPSQGQGTVDIVVRTGDESATLAGAFTFEMPTLAVNPDSVAPGGHFNVKWAGVSPGASGADWIGLFKVGVPNTSYLSYRYTGGAPSGTVTFVAPTQPGQYQFRYLLDDGYIDIMRSAPVTVVPPSLAESTSTHYLAAAAALAARLLNPLLVASRSSAASRARPA